MLTNKDNAVNQLRKSMPDQTFIACEHLEESQRGFPEPFRTIDVGLHTTLVLCKSCSGAIFETIFRELLQLKK